MTAPALNLVESDQPADTLLPARARLADHLRAVARGQADVDRASEPAERLREQLAVATQELTAAEANLAAIDARHAEAIRDQAKNGAVIELAKLPASTDEEAALDRARRNVNAIRAALTECQGDFQQVSSVLREAEAKIEPLVLAVICEEFDTALQARQRAYDSFSDAENHIRGLLDAISARGRALLGTAPEQGRAWLQACERMVLVYGNLPSGVGDFRPAAAQWTARLARLLTDARA